MLLEAHVTSEVITCELLSAKSPVALKFCFVPGAMVRPDGVTVIDTIVVLVTVSVAVVFMDPNTAVIVVVPAVSPLAMPVAPPTVATAVFEEVHVDCDVRLRVLPSLKVPIDCNFRLVFCAIEGLAGEMPSEVRFAALTVSEAVPLITPSAAVIVTVPRFKPVARPLTVIDAVLGAEEVQITIFVMSCVVVFTPSKKVPTALNCWSTPSGIVGLAGVTAIDCSVALVTVSIAVLETVPEGIVIVAVIVDVPGVNPLASPFVGTVSLMVATLVAEEVQLTLLVMSFVLPSS